MHGQRPFPVQTITNIERLDRSWPYGHPGQQRVELQPVGRDELVRMHLLPTVQLLEDHLAVHGVKPGAGGDHECGVVVAGGLCLLTGLAQTEAREQGENLVDVITGKEESRTLDIISFPFASFVCFFLLKERLEKILF